MRKASFGFSLVVIAAVVAVVGCASGTAERGTTSKSRWCSYEVTSSRCEEIRRADTVCFQCNGAANCPDRRSKKVKVGYKGHECVIKLGNRLSETCSDCSTGKKVVELD
jgi:hypothetical protein